MLTLVASCSQRFSRSSISDWRASSDIDNGDGKDVVGRLVVKPFATDKGSRLQELMLGLSASAGSQTGSAALPAYTFACGK